jgi:hypothetical protein
VVVLVLMLLLGVLVVLDHIDHSGFQTTAR